jgi:DNA-binding transcriptional regulator GbsR (MarR family)
MGKRVREVCETVGSFIEYWGFKAIHGRIWTALALHQEPMAQTELAEFLGVSRSLVSGAISELTERGLVRATSEHRNAPYEAVIDIWPSIANVLRGREWMMIESARVALDAAVEEMELSDADARRRYSLDRMRFLLRMTEMAQAFLRLLIGIRVPRKLEGLGDWLKNSAKFIQTLREL